MNDYEVNIFSEEMLERIAEDAREFKSRAEGKDSNTLILYERLFRPRGWRAFCYALDSDWQMRYETVRKILGERNLLPE